MNGEADNSRFVSLYVYMHLAFKELIDSDFTPFTYNMSEITQIFSTRVRVTLFWPHLE